MEKNVEKSFIKIGLYFQIAYIVPHGYNFMWVCNLLWTNFRPFLFIVR